MCPFRVSAAQCKTKSALNWPGRAGIKVKDGQKITPYVLGEHKVITIEQQFLGVILSFLMHLRWPWLLRLFAVLL